MTIGGINLLAVIAGVVVSMVLGFAWYGPLSGKAWLRSTGRTQMSTNAPPTVYVLTIVFALLQTVILAIIVTLTGASTIAAGATMGFLAWLGFVATTQGVDAVYNDRTFTFYAISAGYHLVEYVLVGAILAAWR